MNRATSEKFNSGTDQRDLTKGNACWETPSLVFAKLNEDFGPFDIDLTADKGRALRPKWFGPDGLYLDALKASWSDNGARGYSNPPYGPFVQLLLEKAKRESERGFSSTLLLPMRVTNAFKKYVLRYKERLGASDLLFCDSRLVFFENGLPRLNEKKFKEGKAVPDPAMFDSIVVRYEPGAQTFNVDTWHVPQHVTADDLAAAFARRSARTPAVENAQAIPDHVKTTRGGLIVEPAPV